jgi:hypothetical protein
MSNQPAVNALHTCRNIYILLFALCCVTVSSPAQAQAQTQVPATAQDQTPVVRDAAALQILSAALDAMGGEQAWSSIHSAKVTGTSMEDGATDAVPFTWIDDWQGGHKMRREGTTGAKGQHAFVQPDHAETMQTPNGQAIKKPRFDSVPALITHLPAAAIRIAIDNPHYGVVLSHEIHFDPNSDCVVMTREDKDGFDGVQVELCTAVQTHLPVTAAVSLRNLAGSSVMLAEHIQYKQFQTIDQMLIPQTVQVKKPIRGGSLLTFTSATWNPQVNESAYKGDKQ